MQLRLEYETAALAGVLQSPTRKDPRYFGHVFLGVYSTHSESVQLHQFTCVVLVEPVAAFLLALICPGFRRLRQPARVGKRGGSWTERTIAPAALPGLRERLLGASGSCFGVWPFTLPIIEIEQHGRALSCRYQQVFEFTQNVGPNYIPVVTSNHVAVGAFANKNVEMVKPKVRQHLFELAVAVNRTQQLARLHFVVHQPLWIVEGQDGFPLLWRETRQQHLFLWSGYALEQCRLLAGRQAQDSQHARFWIQQNQLIDLSVSFAPVLLTLHGNGVGRSHQLFTGWFECCRPIRGGVRGGIGTLLVSLLELEPGDSSRVYGVTVSLDGHRNLSVHDCFQDLIGRELQRHLSCAHPQGAILR